MATATQQTSPGMPDLKASFEIGPQLDVTLWRSADRARFLTIHQSDADCLARFKAALAFRARTLTYGLHAAHERAAQ